MAPECGLKKLDQSRLVRRGDDVVEKHDLSKGKKSFVLGRQAGVADILVKDEAVSRQHAALVHRGDALYLIDLKSAAGVTVDGQRIKPNDATALKDGSKFVLGAAPLSYVVRGLAVAKPAAPPAAAPAAGRRTRTTLMESFLFHLGSPRRGVN